MFDSTFLSHRSKITIVAALLAVVVAVTSFLLWPRGGDSASLLTALDAFTGTWAGEASVQAQNGDPLTMLQVTRRYSWVGEKQIVETRFQLGAEEYATRTIQWIEHGRLKAITTGPADDANTFTGVTTADGILWSNQNRPKSDCLEKIVPHNGRPSLQSASFVVLRLGEISGVVGVAAILDSRDTEVAAMTAEKKSSASAELAGAVARVAELERKLAIASRERDELRLQLAHAATAPVATLSVTRSSHLEIRSSPPGMKFEVRTESDKNPGKATTLSTGTTPFTLNEVPPGDYAVILQRDEGRKTVHHVSVRENGDVFLFHREDGLTAGATAVTAPP